MGRWRTPRRLTLASAGSSRPPSDRYRARERPAAAEPAASSAAPARGIAFAVDRRDRPRGGHHGRRGRAADLGRARRARRRPVAGPSPLALKVGAGPTIPRSSRIWLAAGLALAAVVLGQVGLWLFARTEGGVLPLVDYLGETFGPLVPFRRWPRRCAAAWSAR